MDHQRLAELEQAEQLPSDQHLALPVLPRHMHPNLAGLPTPILPDPQRVPQDQLLLRIERQTDLASELDRAITQRVERLRHPVDTRPTQLERYQRRLCLRARCVARLQRRCAGPR
jgi:hypothetical protein